MSAVPSTALVLPRRNGRYMRSHSLQNDERMYTIWLLLFCLLISYAWVSIAVSCLHIYSSRIIGFDPFGIGAYIIAMASELDDSKDRFPTKKRALPITESKNIKYLLSICRLSAALVSTSTGIFMKRSLFFLDGIWHQFVMWTGSNESIVAFLSLPHTCDLSVQLSCISSSSFNLARNSNELRNTAKHYSI